MKPEDKMIERWKKVCKDIEDEFCARIKEMGERHVENGSVAEKDVGMASVADESKARDLGHKLRKRRQVVCRKPPKDKVVIRVGAHALNPETSKVAQALGTYLLETSRLSVARKENETNSVVYDNPSDYTNTAGYAESVVKDPVENMPREREKAAVPRETVKIVLSEKVKPVVHTEQRVVAEAPKSEAIREDPAVVPPPKDTKHTTDTNSDAEEKTATSHRAEDTASGERPARATADENQKLNMAFLQLKSQFFSEKAPGRWMGEDPPLASKDRSLYKAAVINNLRKSPFRAPRFHPNLYKPQTEVPPIDSDDELSMDLGFSVPVWAKNPRLNEEVRAQSHDELSMYFKNADPINVYHIFPNVKNVTNDSPNKWEPSNR